ncbi:MAG: Na/Pi cotransporter family protein [Clostridia bacterium]|nr:Na/Pi cotransporter family protein [Clostridia bacterium]
MTDAILGLLGGLALFLFGMTVMGDALEKTAGNKLKSILSKMTSNPILGFLLGAGVTAVIQSSSATTVMLVGFVNAGLIKLRSAIPVIMGANVGTTITAWILSLSGIEGGAWYLEIVKPSNFTPILAIIGMVLFVFLKSARLKDIGLILLGFSCLIFGMDMMSDGFKTPEIESFLGSFFEMFATNPVLGLLTGAVITAIIQSSSASVGILQTIAGANPGMFNVAMALPIIMGQNIGTCITAVLGSAGANKDAKRVAAVHLSFNIIGSTVMLAVFCLLHYLIIPGGFGFAYLPADEFSISVIHTVFNVVCSVLLLPCYKLLERLAIFLVRDKKGETEERNLFDDRLLSTPAIAIEQAKRVTYTMAEKTDACLADAISLFGSFDKKVFERVAAEESKIDVYEDEIGSYLVKITGCDLTESESLEVSRLLHTINDLERLSDHAVNLACSAKEMYDKKISFSSGAREEMRVMIRAVEDILSLTFAAFRDNDLERATRVEPLEEVIDMLQSEIRANHINRLKNNECTIELGFILTDMLTDLERVSDHCSNIAGCVIEITHKSLGMHEYTRSLKSGNAVYDEYLKSYSNEYRLKV